MNSEQRKAIRDLISAIEDSGPDPKYHYEMMKCHREEWPTLWKAIGNIRKTFKGHI